MPEAMRVTPTPPAVAEATPDAALLAALSAEIHRVLDPLIPPDRPVALLDFNDAPNVGDGMIWCGALAYLARRRLRLCYTCSNLTYSREILAGRIGEGTILLAGGGNFGDLYPDHQELREAVLADFPRHRIVQLPQSVHFESGAALESSRRAFAAHPHVQLVVRDRASLGLASRHFDVPLALCPDMAFAIGRLERAQLPVCDVVWLAREDKEAAARHCAAPAGVERLDWLRDDPVASVRACGLLTRGLRSRPWLRPGLQDALSATYGPVARERLRRGVRLLGRGRVVVSDRLHAHILCLLLGLPHMVLDNSYGKVRALVDTWTRDAALATWCGSETEALERATSLAERMRAAGG